MNGPLCSTSWCMYHCVFSDFVHGPVRSKSWCTGRCVLNLGARAYLCQILVHGPLCPTSRCTSHRVLSIGTRANDWMLAAEQKLLRPLWRFSMSSSGAFLFLVIWYVWLFCAEKIGRIGPLLCGGVVLPTARVQEADCSRFVP